LFPVWHQFWGGICQIGQHECQSLFRGVEPVVRVIGRSDMRKPKAIERTGLLSLVSLARQRAGDWPTPLAGGVLVLG
jgi:hypothetical protein